MPFDRMHTNIMVQLPKIGVAQLSVTAQLPAMTGGVRAGA